MARLRRRLDHRQMVPIGEDLAAPPALAIPQCGVDVPRGRDHESLHPAGERCLVLGLDQQVHVVALQADMNDPEPFAQRRGDRGIAHRLVHRTPAQAADHRHDPHHDVQRMVRFECGSSIVPFPGPRALGLSSCSTPLAAAPEQLPLNMSLPVLLRLRRHDLLISIVIPTVN